MAYEESADIPESRRRVLLLVPEDSGRELVRTTLREMGLVPIVATDEYDAISQAHAEAAKLLVISLSGLRRKDSALLVQLQRYFPEMRRLLIVPEGRRQDVAAFLEAGADAMLPSPYYPAELRLLVRSLLRSDAGDPLTGLPNKAAFERASQREVERARRENRSLGLAILDIDDFKQVNERCGYKAGDLVLKEVARVMRETLRVTDLVARWGGEEFGILVTGLPADREDACRLVREALERVRLAVGALAVAIPRHFQSSCPDVRPQVSGGFAVYPHAAGTADELFVEANHRLRLAKQPPKNRVVGCDLESVPPPKPGPEGPRRRRGEGDAPAS